VPLLGAKHVFALWSGDDLWLVTPPLLYRLLYVVPGHLLGEGLDRTPRGVDVELVAMAFGPRM
jgi:hypothetical protein